MHKKRNIPLPHHSLIIMSSLHWAVEQLTLSLTSTQCYLGLVGAKRETTHAICSPFRIVREIRQCILGYLDHLSAVQQASPMTTMPFWAKQDHLRFKDWIWGEQHSCSWVGPENCFFQASRSSQARSGYAVWIAVWCSKKPGACRWLNVSMPFDPPIFGSFQKPN